MVTFNALERVLMIRFRDSVGSAFTYDIDDRRFIVTSQQIVEGINGNDRIEYFKDGAWASATVNLVGKTDPRIDIIVLSSPDSITVDHDIYATKGYLLGEDVYLLGFPFGNKMDYHKIGLSLPIPVVKKAIISAVNKTDNGILILLDGFYSSGLSGGPVVKMRDGKVEVISVISDNRSFQSPVYSDGVPTKSFIYENSGIVLSYAFQHAIDIMKANIRMGLRLY